MAGGGAKAKGPRHGRDRSTARTRGREPHARKAGFHRIALYLLTDVTIRARTALALGMHERAAREIRFLQARRDGWAAAIGGALHACLAAARRKPDHAARGLEQAIGKLEHWKLGLYAVAARYRYAQVTADSALERAAIDDLAKRGVRAPERMFSNLLPLP